MYVCMYVCIFLFKLGLQYEPEDLTSAIYTEKKNLNHFIYIQKLKKFKIGRDNK